MNEWTPPAAVGGVFFLLFGPISLPRYSWTIWVILVILGLAVGFAGRLLFDFPKSRMRMFSTLLLMVAGFLLSWSSQSGAAYIDAQGHAGLNIELIERATLALDTDPRLVGPGRWTADGRLVQVSGHSIVADAKGRIRLWGWGELPETGMGSLLVVQGSLRRTTNVQLGDPPFQCSVQDIDAHSWRKEFFRWRYGILTVLRRNLQNTGPDTQSFLTAVLLGIKTDTGSFVMRSYRYSGCMHLLALSGFHVGFIALAVRYFLRLFTGFHSSLIVSAVFAVMFLLVVGIRPSLLRAVLMYVAWTRDRLRGYRVPLTGYLATAFILQVIICPRTVELLSFRLSYAALAGLAFLGPVWTRILARLMPRKASGMFGVGLSAQLATLPWVVGAFGVWRPVGLVASVVLTPLTALTMAAGSLRLILGGGYSYFANHVDGFLDILVGFLGRVAAPFAAVPDVIMGLPSAWLVCGVGTILPLAFVWSVQRRVYKYSEPRFPGLNPGIPQRTGDCTSEEVGTELSDQPGGPAQNCQSAGSF